MLPRNSLPEQTFSLAIDTDLQEGSSYRAHRSAGTTALDDHGAMIGVTIASSQNVACCIGNIAVVRCCCKALQKRSRTGVIAQYNTPVVAEQQYRSVVKRKQTLDT